MTKPAKIEIDVVIREGCYEYRLLKVVRTGFDVYCIPPHLGVHCSFHGSGEVHLRFEGKAAESEQQPPVVLMTGEAGRPSGEGFICAPLDHVGRAVSICNAGYPIDSLSQDFRKFNHSAEECFVIDRRLFPEDIGEIEIGVWAVPGSNEVSFEFNNPNIPANLLYKAEQCEPQIWIYARPIGRDWDPEYRSGLGEMREASPIMAEEREQIDSKKAVNKWGLDVSESIWMRADKLCQMMDEPRETIESMRPVLEELRDAAHNMWTYWESMNR